MATKGDLSLAQVTALVRLSKKIKTLPKPKEGPKGEKGVQGEKGVRGPEGPKGEQGKEGVKGEKGTKGETGTKGKTGETGEKGDPGSQILAGKSKPQPKEGSEGDFYVQKAPLTFYGPKKQSTWGKGIEVAKKGKEEISGLTVGGQLPGEQGS